MSTAVIALRPVNDLLDEKFFVPSYQRGYRWTERQVQDLLVDIWEFQAKADTQTKEAFYCLQPIVVKRREQGDWELVDGQQRLTTILLILIQLEDIVKLLVDSTFTLGYETRGATSGIFLQNIDRNKRNDNIDFYHICNAADAINDWFAARNKVDKLTFIQCLLNTNANGKNVKVIWYELPDTDDSVAAFTRLNVGKIALTNAELIRALFLRSANFDDRSVSLYQLQIAQEWDQIEKKFQSNDFWYFLNQKEAIAGGRIEYLFRLLAAQGNASNITARDPYATFHFYNGRINGPDKNATSEWLNVKQHFMNVEEWFADRALYHLVGYLLNEGDNLLEILEISEKAKKSVFENLLKKRIFARATGLSLTKGMDQATIHQIIRERVDGLDYESHKEKIRSFLLLFNIVTLLANPDSNLRFPFDAFKTSEWDLEHVRSVDSNIPKTAEGQKQWLINAMDCLTRADLGDGLHDEISQILNAGTWPGIERFRALYECVRQIFGEGGSGEVDHSFGNLVLLDENTNRSYRNAVFPVKRLRILGLDRTGTFVPLCTKNVFTKYYSGKLDQMMFWTSEDAAEYQNAVVDILSAFFASESGA